MNFAPEPIPIIETTTYETMKFIVGHVAATAGLGIVKGPVGIGKSFAISRLSAELTDSIRIISIRATPEIEGSILGFTTAILEQFGVRESRSKEAVQALGSLLAAFPFRPFSRPTVLIVDEAQGLKHNVLETLRGLYDAGDAAREGDPNAPAFGLLLCGNRYFLGRTGRRMEMDYAQLRSRISCSRELRKPSNDELLRFSEALPQLEPDAQKELASIGARGGNFRTIARAFRQSERLAAGGKITAKMIQDAAYMMGELQ